MASIRHPRSSTPSADPETSRASRTARRDCASSSRRHKVDKTAVEDPGVLGAVPQAGDRFQVVIGGGVQNVYNDIMALP
jgi:hypothetical protein